MNFENIFLKIFEWHSALTKKSDKVGRLVPEQFLFLKKALCKVKTSGQHLTLICFGRVGHE